MTSVEYPHLVGEASRNRGGEGVTHFVVYGQDGRRVGLFTADELREFRARIAHAARHGVPEPNATPATVGRPEQPRFETFRIHPVDGAGNAAGDPEEWTPPQAA